MDAVFRALSDPSRRRLLDRLNEQNGQNLTELCRGLDMARQSVTKHLDVLEAANLVTTIRRGREKLHYLNVAPINEIAERWINHYDHSRVAALADLKRALEETSMQKPEFVYTTYIRATPEMVWQGLTEPAFTRRYWGLAFESDWKAGSTFTVVLDKGGVRIGDPEQVVLESDPYRRLAYTWHTFTTEWADAYGFSEEYRAQMAGEPRSKVSFDIEPLGPMVELTVVHDGFGPTSKVLAGVSQGWPQLLASLKTLLETGEPLPAPSDPSRLEETLAQTT
ncbi:MAG: ArsR/SmtB family transcription factor [Acidimicrobiales bacterium]